MYPKRFHSVAPGTFDVPDACDGQSGYAKINSMQWAKKQKPGFTIVELLIVVVVIAILAAITIVSFNGITERARVSSAKSFASQLLRRDAAQASGYWNFNECSGSTVANTAGNASTATNAVLGTVSWSTDTPSGTGCSLNFNSNSFITTIPLSNSYYMKSAWIKTASTASALNIVSDATATNTAFFLSVSKASAGHNGGWSVTQGTTDLNDDKWHFVTAEFTQNASGTNGTMVITVDGSVVATQTSVALMTDVENSFQQIGAYRSTSYFNGRMDDVMVLVK